jgi:ABC-2 type transport system permease protein
MFLRRIGALAGRIIGQFRHDRRTLALVFVVPLVIMTILNFVLASSESNLKLAIVPPAEPFGSQLVSQIKDAVPDKVTVSTVDSGAVDSTLKAGDADGVLIFPSDFAAQLQSGSATVTLRVEGSNPAASAQLKQLAGLLVTALSQPRATAGSSALAPSAPSAPSAPKVTLDTTYLFGGAEFTQTDALAPLFIALFAFFFVFLLTAVAFLRERSQGTLERLMVSPLSRTELVLGYVTGFTLFALIQSIVILLFVIYVLRVHTLGNLPLIFLVTVTLTIAAVNLGIFLSAFARNELQIIQFIPLVLVPQALLGGLFFPVETLPIVLKQAAYVMPLTYANFALKDVMLRGQGLETIWADLVFLVGFAAAMVVLAAISLRRQRA